jgi:hypothetical protein
MNNEQQVWLDQYAVRCKVFKGRWSIRHCLKMYNDIKDLRIQMSSRASGQVNRYESSYNPCERCSVLARYFEALNAQQSGGYRGDSGGVYGEMVAV